MLKYLEVIIILYEVLCACTTYVGVYLSLRGTVYANNSVIRVTEIGETNPDTDLNEGLQCVTDRLPCCRTAFRAGEWYLYSRTGANRTVVPGPLDVVGFYRNRGYDDGTVNLNRLSGVVMPIGQFCCEVPDIAGNNQSLCAYIGKTIKLWLHVITATAS